MNKRQMIELYKALVWYRIAHDPRVDHYDIGLNETNKRLKMAGLPSLNELNSAYEECLEPYYHVEEVA